ncbi:MAG: NADH-quinone oxidoreductase subunit D [bacterium]|nr:NADH-quinone oxidoreductase subunit D [bacterium]
MAEEPQTEEHVDSLASRVVGEGEEGELQFRDMFLNMGPAHPAMHGIVRILVRLDGETVLGADVEIGYLHRAFEKSCEVGGYNQVIPYTDRLNYVSPIINNVGYAMAVEKLFGITTPERCQYILTLMSEISRITDHLTCIGASAMELGAFTVFLYMIEAREFLYDLLEEVTGARLTVSYGRIGGVKADLPEGFDDECREAIVRVRKIIGECHGLLTKNRIFIDRMRDVGVISPERALAYAFTGPMLRSTGVNYDVRKAQPYLVYDRMDFIVPLGTNGDNYDRYLVRMEEIEQSCRIIEQCLEQIPPGPIFADLTGEPIETERMLELAKHKESFKDLYQVKVDIAPTLQGSERIFHDVVATDDRRAFLPPKEEVYENIESLMNHFKLVMFGHGIEPPKGEAYQAVEGANGELGFYVVSDGSGQPYRVRCRGPCFNFLAALHEMLIGDMVADVVPTFGSVNMIGGELDR